MAWEQRSGNAYYYRKQRVGGKVVSVYASRWGTGDKAARLDREARQAKRRQRDMLQCFYEEHREIDRAIHSYRQQMRTIVNMVLTLSGFHRHKGQWRKRRGDMELTDIKTHAEEYKRLFHAATVANNDEAPEVQQLQAFADANPDVFAYVGTIGDTVIVTLVKKAAPDRANEISITGELRLMYKRLGGDKATALEQLLIRDVIVCYMRVVMMEQEYTQYSWLAGHSNLAKAAFLEKRLSATRRRYLQSIEALARVRSLLARVPLQVNVAQNMVVQNSN